MCLAQGHNTVTSVGIEPRTSRFGVRRSFTTPPKFSYIVVYLLLKFKIVHVCSIVIDFEEMNTACCEFVFTHITHCL